MSEEEYIGICQEIEGFLNKCGIGSICGETGKRLVGISQQDIVELKDISNKCHEIISSFMLSAYKLDAHHHAYNYIKSASDKGFVEAETGNDIIFKIKEDAVRESVIEQWGKVSKYCSDVKFINLHLHMVYERLMRIYEDLTKNVYVEVKQEEKENEG